MARVLYFEQITDDRFDKDIKNLLEERVEKIKKLLNIEGVEVKVDPIYELDFGDSHQYRCKFNVRKNTRNVTWNYIYSLVNSIKAVPYSFYSEK